MLVLLTSPILGDVITDVRSKMYKFMTSDLVEIKRFHFSVSIPGSIIRICNMRKFSGLKVKRHNVSCIDE